MLGLLLALLGGMMGLAGGGGSKAAPAPDPITTPDTGTGGDLTADTPVVDPNPPVVDTPKTSDPVVPVIPVTDDGNGDMPMPDNDGHGDHGGGTITTPDNDNDNDNGGQGGNDGGTITIPDTGSDTGGHGDHGGGTISTPDTGSDNDGHGDHGGGTITTPDTGSDSGDVGGHGDHGGGTIATPDNEGDAGGGTISTPHDGHDSADLPTTPEEIAEFVHAVRTADEMDVHTHGSSLHTEHMQAMSLAPPADATHIAIGNGSWFDPSNWHNGEVPGDDSMVVVPNGVHLTYDQESDARLFTVRVDGHLEFANDVDSKMVVDTMLVAPGGTLTAGTEAEPIADDVSVEIVIANNGPIDTDWDPALMSRGLISHGKAEIHGQIKDSHEKVVEDPMAGDTSIRFAEIPEGWEVGDKIVIAGTHYEGYAYDNAAKRNVYNEPEDEVRYISKIEGNQVFFDDPLDHDHDTPRADLHTSVANYSRSVTIRSEDPDGGEVFERGHVMFMHSDDVDVRYAAFDGLGRTDKSSLSQESSDFDNIAFDSNVTGRYALHLHRLGIDDLDNPAILTGNAVFGSPGWGVVHHDSNAVLDNNATYDTFGAGFVSETGNETGAWNNNIAIDAQGRSWGAAKVQVAEDLSSEFDTAVSGDGFWFQSRMVESNDNVAASVNHGFIYFHRGPLASKNGGDGQRTFDAESFEYPGALFFEDNIRADDVPILHFNGNETFASRSGLSVVKANPNQGHDVRSVLEDFTAWNVKVGTHLEYTSHYTLKDFDLIAREDDPSDGIDIGPNTTDIVIDGGNIEGFDIGIDLNKKLVGFTLPDGDHDFVVINTDLSDNKAALDDYDPAVDLVLDIQTLPEDPEVGLDLKELVYVHNTKMYIGGTKTDSLGTTSLVSGTDSISIEPSEIAHLLDTEGYFKVENGDHYFTFDVYFSDRLTGDIYKQKALVRLDDSVDLKKTTGYYKNAINNGETTLAELYAATSTAEQVLDRSEPQQDALAAPDAQAHQTMDHAAMVPQETQNDTLWDTLTSGQGTYDEQGLALEEDSHEEQYLMLA